MQDFFKVLFDNKILIITIWGWFIAQSIKVLLGVIVKKKFDFRWFVGTGGMPSAHASGASALATATGINLGFDSAIFALAVMFALVVMFDAQGVRRATGKQAQILNKVMEDIYWKGRIQENSLKELIGHTPLQVIIGSFLGISIALFLN
ncbi:MAG TPA: divergent PAP2 family protein [Candidatus Omnitrophica bacterium]|nr:divergent PAP2 family protein [Candidatus Omnitrophota bacterium]